MFFKNYFRWSKIFRVLNSFFTTFIFLFTFFIPFPPIENFTPSKTESEIFSQSRNSVVKVMVYYSLQVKNLETGSIKIKPKNGAIGTGSVFEQKENSTLILTASHVCDLNKSEVELFEPEFIINPKKFEVSRDYVIKIETLDGDIKDGLILVTNKEIDVCVILTLKIDKPALPIASENIKIGEKALNISLPANIFSKNLIPLFDGFYVGEFERLPKINSSAYSIPATAGSSGSPILNLKGEMVGMLHSVVYDFNHLSLSMTLNQLNQTKEASEKYFRENSKLMISVLIKLSLLKNITNPI